MIKKFLLLTLLCVIAGSVGAVQLTESIFDKEHDAIRYQLYISSFGDEGNNPKLSAEDWSGDKSGGSNSTPGYRSPGKAFIMSMIVPGAGQYYNGSKIKAASFLGIEIVTIALALKAHSQGEDLTVEFEEFNSAHWSRDAYSSYVDTVYGGYADSVPIFSHTLPETDTQQYFEMTGKYDQFSWGWDDANLNGELLIDFWGRGGPPPLSYATGSIPVSERRLHYEQMRADANSKFENSRRTVYVTMFNHVASAFEAFLSARKHNNNSSRSVEDFSWKVRAGMKSLYTFYDTPTVKVSYSF